MVDPIVDPNPSTGFVLPEKWYNLAKWFVTIVLPAFSTLYFTLGSVFELPGVTQVVGTCAALATFLGVVLGLSTRSYNKSDARFGGVMDVSLDDEGKKLFSLELNKDPDDLEKMKEVTFKVSPSTEVNPGK